MATLELKREAQPPPRIQNTLDVKDYAFNRARRTALVQIFPSVYLLATVKTELNQCVIELLYKDNNGVPESSFSSSRRLSTGESFDGTGSVCTAQKQTPPVPQSLLNQFRTPLVIQVVHQDEGLIMCVEFAVDTLPPKQTTAGGARGEAVPDIAKSGRRRSASQAAADTDLNGLYVHLFIGTSHGTVICCNALRGTILVMAQFQYRPPFQQTNSNTTTNNSANNTDVDRFLEDDLPDYDSPNKSKNITQIFSRHKKENEPVVKFVLHRRPTALQYNPSINLSTSKLAPLVCVYVIHSAGRVVVLNRSVLDVFVQTAEDKQDGRRPNFAVDWSPEETSFPVAGAAASFASQVQSVYVLRKLSQFSSNEAVTYKKETGARIHEMRSGAASIDGDTVIRDASYFLFLDDTDVTNVLSQNQCTVDALILCGRKPAVSIYPLEPQHEEYSASRSVKAIVSKAKNLWYTAWGKHRTEPPKKLEEIPQLASTGMLEGDSTFSTVVVDPSQQCAALFCEEGSGRLYLVDIPTGTIWRVLKGCREAQFQFWMVQLLGRRVLCIVVHLPLRKVVEVHAVRIVQRLAACSVPEGALLLPPTSETSSPVLIDPMGGVHTLVLDTQNIQKDMDAYEAAPEAASSAEGQRAPRLSQTVNGEFVNAATLRACRTPDVYLNLALCLPLPFTEPLPSEAVDTKCAEERKALALFVTQTAALCEHLKLRFAPSSTDIRILPYDATMQDRLQCGAPPADSITAAQCLHYVQLRAIAVESYMLLSRCPSPTANEIASLFAAEKSKALWNVLLNGVHNDKAASAYWSSAVETMLLLVRPSSVSTTTNSSVFSDLLRSFWQKLQDDRIKKELFGDTGALSMDLKAFLACFFFGESRMRFLGDSIRWQEEAADENCSAGKSFSGAIPATASTSANSHVFLSLSLLILGKGGLPSFLGQMEIVSQLGMSAQDLCLLVLSYLTYKATTSTDKFLQETNLGMLAFILGTFPDAVFLDALDYLALPLLRRAKGNSTPTAPVWQVDPVALPTLTCVVLCCALWSKEREATLANMTADQRRRWRLTLGKLLCLWRLSSTGAQTTFQDTTPSSPTSKKPTAPRTANSVKLRLKNLNMDTTAAQQKITPSDTLESVLVGKGLPPGVVEQLQGHLRMDAAEIAKARSYVRLMSIYQPTEGRPSSDWNTSEFPWLRQGNWYSAHFESLVVQPLEDVWQKQQGDSLFCQSCVVVLSWNICYNLVCRNFDNAFLFFPMHTVPSANFLSSVQSGKSPVGQTAGKVLWLAEGRSTRSYLQSMIKLVKFVRRATREMLLGRRDEKAPSPKLSKGDISDMSQAQRVRLVQTIISALCADDDLVFPCVPQPFRVCLENMKDVVGNAPLLLLSRLDGLYSFLQLVLLFVEGSVFQVEEKSIASQVETVPIHWAALFQQPQSYFNFLDLFCDRKCGAERNHRNASELVGQDDREIRLIRQRLRASSVLVRDLLDIAIMADDHVPCKNYLSDVSLARLFSKDTAAILDRVCQITDISTYVPEVTPLFLFDYQIKHLCPNKEIAKTFANLTNKKQGAVIAVANLRLLVAAVMSYCEGIRKPTTRTTVLREGATYEADDFIGRIYRLLTETKCLQWVKRLEADVKRTAEDLTGVTDSRIAPTVVKKKAEGLFSGEVIGGYSWVTPREQVDVVKRVQLRLTASTLSSQRTDFAELLFTLAQMGNENAGAFSEEIALFVHDLPRVANGLRSVI